jgi:hypothetical protein
MMSAIEEIDLSESIRAVRISNERTSCAVGRVFSLTDDIFQQ